MTTRLISREGRFTATIIQQVNITYEEGGDFIFKCMETGLRSFSEKVAINSGRSYLRKKRKKYRKQVAEGKIKVGRRRKYVVCPPVTRHRKYPVKMKQPTHTRMTLAELIRKEMEAKGC